MTAPVSPLASEVPPAPHIAAVDPGEGAGPDVGGRLSPVSGPDSELVVRDFYGVELLVRPYDWRDVRRLVVHVSLDETGVGVELTVPDVAALRDHLDGWLAVNGGAS